MLFSLSNFIQFYFTFSELYLEYFLIWLILFYFIDVLSEFISGIVFYPLLRLWYRHFLHSWVYEWVIALQIYNAFVHVTPENLLTPAQAKHSSNYAGNINATAWGNNRPVENISSFCTNKNIQNIQCMLRCLSSLLSLVKTQWIGLKSAVSFPALMHFLLKWLLKTKTCHKSACSTDKSHTLTK